MLEISVDKDFRNVWAMPGTTVYIKQAAEAIKNDLIYFFNYLNQLGIQNLLLWSGRVGE